MRFFNTAGLCFPEDHYTLDPLRRLPNILELIKQKKYFTIHAPRQTGKTTSMRALMEYLNREGDYITLHFSCESASVTGENFDQGNDIIAEDIMEVARDLPESERPVKPVEYASGRLLQTMLENWARAQQKPIVLLFDEIDSLSDLTLISVLRQLRNGYQRRPASFPQAVALIGLKDVRDYRVKVREELESMGTASPCLRGGFFESENTRNNRRGRFAVGEGATDSRTRHTPGFAGSQITREACTARD